jgi:hypothetical protein
MTTYAGIKFGWVIETFTPLPEWEHLDPHDLFSPELHDEWVSIDGLDPPPSYGWRYDGTTFTAPEPLVDAAAIIADMRKLYPGQR